MPRRLRRALGSLRDDWAGPIVVTLAVFSSAVAAAAVLSGATPRATPPEGDEVVRGVGKARPIAVTVRDGDTGKPVPGVGITGGSTEATTDASGRAEVRAKTRHQLRAFKPAWLEDVSRVSKDTTSMVLEVYSWAHQWPKFGYDLERTGYNPNFTVKPPYKLAWKYHAKSLLEYPVSAYKGKVVGVTGRGKIFCLDARTGRELWSRKLEALFAAQPAVDGRRMYIGAMNRRVYAIRTLTGKTDWAFDTGGPIESSIVLDDDRLYVGSWNNAVFCLDRDTGRALWRFRTGGAVKGTPAIHGDLMYFGAYDGSLYCVDKRRGRLKWRAYIGGNVYSSPAVSDGRVYVGTAAGHLSCFNARTGRRLWRYTTGNRRFGVYSSPAVAHGLVYFGSYDGVFYALNARSGGLAWTFTPGGAISGSPAVIGRIVYLASFRNRSWALGARNGRLLWRFPDGRYTPAAANGRYLYIAGVKWLYAYKGPREAR